MLVYSSRHFHVEGSGIMTYLAALWALALKLICLHSMFDVSNDIALVVLQVG